MLGFLKWGFRATVNLHTSEKDVSPTIKGSTTFHDFVRLLPIIDTSKKLWLNPLLFNGSLQTIYYATHDSSTEFKAYYGRELFEYKDKGMCSLDWVIPPPASEQEFQKIYTATLPENSPRLHPRTRFFTADELRAKTEQGQTPESKDPICVVLHGLAGGSHEPLIRNLGQYLQKTSANNWDVVVINNRGCCRTKITTGKLFNAFSTEDIREVLVELRRRYPSRPIFAVGFSFGAVILANYLGSGDANIENLVQAAVLVGCPWDLEDSAHHIDLSITGRYLLNPNLTSFLNKLVKSNLLELKVHEPDLFCDENVKNANEAKKTWQWDNIFTCKTAGFLDSWGYYREGSPIRRIGKIQTPTLIINSTDDPAVSIRLPYLEVRSNPNLAMVETNLGGHLGFVKYSGEFWCVEVADDFFNKFHDLTK